MRLINQNEYGFTDLRRQHLWQVPERFNMAAAVCDRHVWKRDAVALFSETKNNLKDEIPIFVIGLGSNVLIRDGGFRGLIIKLGKSFNTSVAKFPSKLIIMN